jgi:hypothetical protein
MTQGQNIFWRAPEAAGVITDERQAIEAARAVARLAAVDAVATRPNISRERCVTSCSTTIDCRHVIRRRVFVPNLMP